ncbi:MAG: FecR domain-containing protein, partial [Rhodospirillales bacterium]|nr:FecR domain-containing protein [Rhodospirillales bacterium]
MAVNDNISSQAQGSGSPLPPNVIEAAGATEVVLPEGTSLASADFSREGSDLILNLPDGQQIIVQDFYDGDAAPALVVPDGGRVSGEWAAKLAGPLTPGQFAQAEPTVSAQPIGSVEKADGVVMVVRADGTRVELQVGDPVYQGDLLETGGDGAVGIVLADETTFSMGENGSMVLDEMVFDPSAQEGKISMSIVKGVFTFVSGQVAKTDPDAMTLNTPVATIGIRGTQAGIDIADGKTLTVALMEEADGFVGEVTVTNGAGQVIVNVANMGTKVFSFMQPPSAVFSFDAQEMIDLFATPLKYLPLNSPSANDFGLQGDAEGMSEADIADLANFETAAGGNDNAPGQQENPGGGRFNAVGGDYTGRFTDIQGVGLSGPAAAGGAAPSTGGGDADGGGDVSGEPELEGTAGSEPDEVIAEDVTAEANEDGSYTITLVPEGSDLTVSEAGITSGAGEVEVTEDGKGITYSTGSAYDPLAEGETDGVEVTYTLVDPDGNESAPGTVDITVTGTDDASVITGVTVGEVTEGGEVV